MLKKYSKDINGQKKEESQGQFAVGGIVCLTTTAGINFDAGINLHKFIETR